MSEIPAKNILVLKTGLFPDQPMMERAVRAIESSSNIRTTKIVPEQMDKTSWAKVLEEIMSANMLIAL